MTSNCSKRDCSKRERVLTPCLDRAGQKYPKIQRTSYVYRPLCRMTLPTAWLMARKASSLYHMSPVKKSSFKFRFPYYAFKSFVRPHLFSAVCRPIWLTFCGVFLTTPQVKSQSKFQPYQSTDGREKVCPTQLWKAKYINLNSKGQVWLLLF